MENGSEEINIIYYYYFYHFLLLLNKIILSFIKLNLFHFSACIFRSNTFANTL